MSRTVIKKHVFVVQKHRNYEKVMRIMQIRNVEVFIHDTFNALIRSCKVLFLGTFKFI